MCGASENIVNVDIVVPNQTRYLSLIGNIAEQIAKQLDTAKGDRDTLAYHLDLALTEAMANAIQYGCPANYEAIRAGLSFHRRQDLVRQGVRSRTGVRSQAVATRFRRFGRTRARHFSYPLPDGFG